MAKRKTRHMTVEDDNTSISELNFRPKKRARGKNTSANKLSFDEQSDNNNIGNSKFFCDILLRVCFLVDAATFTALEPVLFDQPENTKDQENSSPPPLIIDTDTETCSSQSLMSDYIPRTEPIGERLSSGTRIAVNKTHNDLSSNATHSTLIENHSIGIDRLNKERSSEGNL